MVLLSWQEMSFIVPAIFLWCQCQMQSGYHHSGVASSLQFCRTWGKEKWAAQSSASFSPWGQRATASFGATIIVLEFAKTPTEVKSARKNLPSVHPSMTWWHPRNLPSGSLTYHFACLNTWKLELQLGCQIVYFQAVTVKLGVEGCEAEIQLALRRSWNCQE